MNEQIVRFSNKFIYENKMRCANDDVRFGRMDVDVLPNSYPQWIRRALHPQNNVCFIDLDSLSNEYVNGISLDCRMTKFVLKHLTEDLGFDQKEIGVITPLNKSKNALTQRTQGSYLCFLLLNFLFRTSKVTSTQ